MIHLSFTTKDLVRSAWTAVFAFVAVFIPLATGAGQLHNYDDAKAAVIALVPAAIAAALAAVKNGLLADGTGLKG